MRKKISSIMVIKRKFIVVCSILLFIVGCSSVEKELNDVIQEITTPEETIQTEKQEVEISRVIDGDTVEVKQPNGEIETVRLLLIDTPESVHPDKAEQPYGKESSDFARKKLEEGKKVQLEKGDPEYDKYGRVLGYIWLDGKNFNELMIEHGYARIAYVYEPNTKYLDEFKKAEKKARDKKSKIWSIKGYAESEFEKY